MLETLIPATSVLFQFYPAQVQAIEKAFAEAPAEASRMLADKYSEISISAVLAALLEMGLEMVEIVAVTAGIGAMVGGAIGFSAGGVGAVPGAAIGLDIGVQAGILIAGIFGFLVMTKDFLKASANAATHLGLGIQAAWNAGESDQHSPIYDINLNAARNHIASALVILIDELIVAIILVLLHKKPGLEKLRATENGQKLERWAAENQAKLNKWYRDKIKSFERVGDDEVPPEPILETINKVEGAFGREVNLDTNDSASEGGERVGAKTNGAESTSKVAGATYKDIIDRVPGHKLSEADALTPGVLGDDLKGLPGTFSGGRYATMQLDQPLTVYRAWSPGQSREFGAFWSLDEPGGSLQTRIDSALLPEWGNIRGTPFNAQATQYTTIQLPVGTTIHIGEVGSQGGAWVGGKSQLLIEGGAQPAWKIGDGTLQ